MFMHRGEYSVPDNAEWVMHNQIIDENDTILSMEKQ